MPARVQDLSQLTKRDLARMHDALDLAGLATPAADVINAALYLLEGDIKNAAISAVAVIPGAGDAVGIGRIAYKGGKYIDKGKGIIDAATKGDKASRETILETEKTYERARNVLMEELDKTGRFKNGSNANFGRLKASYGYGKIIGRISHDEKVRWRLDYDPEKGVHINIDDFSNGKGSKRIKLKYSQ